MLLKIVGLKNIINRSFITNKMKNKYDTLKGNVSSKITFPDKFKGTILEKWGKYWRQLMIDYKDVFVDLGKEIKNKPIKSSIYFSVAGTILYCTKNNPKEIDFIDQLRKYNTEMILVDESCHNTISSQYLTYIERCYNEGIIRHMNLGVISILWIDNYDKSLQIYKAMCPFLKPEYLLFHNRIIDIGFLNKWWILQDKMIDYDVN